MAIFVLIHGAWHGGWAWEDVAAYLCGSGHLVAMPDLPGLGTDATETDAPAITLRDHIDAVTAHIDRIADGPLHLVVHSYAGMIGRAIEHLRPKRLAHIVFLEAVLAAPGQSLLDTLPAAGIASLDALKRTTASGVLLDTPDVAKRFEIADIALAARIQHRLKPHPFRTFSEPLPNSFVVQPGLYRRTHIFAADRRLNPYQYAIDACTRDESWQVIGLSGGHEMMLTNPAALADTLARLVTNRDDQPQLT